LDVSAGYVAGATLLTGYSNSAEESSSSDNSNRTESRLLVLQQQVSITHEHDTASQ